MLYEVITHALENDIRKMATASYDPKWKREAQRRMQIYTVMHMRTMVRWAELFERNNIDSISDLEWIPYAPIKTKEHPEGILPENLSHMFVRMTANLTKEMADGSHAESIAEMEAYYVPEDFGLPLSEIRRRDPNKVESARVQTIV